MRLSFIRTDCQALTGGIGMKFGTGLPAFLRIFPTAFLCGLFTSQNHRSYSHAVFVCMQFLKYHSDLNKPSLQFDGLMLDACFAVLSLLALSFSSSRKLIRGAEQRNQT